MTPSWPTAVPLSTPRLLLEPLRVEHAREAAPVLDDVRLHTWTGGGPATPALLRDRYARLVAGRSPDGTRGWLNWMLRLREREPGAHPPPPPYGPLVGTVQATLHRPADGGLEAALAWVVAVDHQGRGYARESALAMAARLREEGVTRLTAYVHPDHHASAGVARALGLTASGTVVDGEVRWSDGGTE
ncbi:GNAT family N-acetyltransferase [Streptomyces sp. Z26]|uniref:GNAT family N-acetyltransferase n=1 Tax=Streptomyces sp. Z26 TaxID=2500177 RepID=UPI001F0BCE58|nr:GNAT family N-acetyltransferase [Streptomyces sp. Z26]